MSRVLETVLTGRNLLSPVLATAARDVASYTSTVTTAQGRAATSATTAARNQQTATTQVVAANSRVAASASTTAATQTRAHGQAVTSAQAMAAAQTAASQSVISANTRLAGAVNGTTATYQRSAASLREKLGLQALDGAAADRSAAANSKAAASAAVFTRAIDSNSSSLARDTTASAASTTATRANTTAREQASVAARAQASATSALASSNGLLGTSLTPLTAGVGAVGLAIGYASFRGAEFGAAMSEVSAASGATGATLDQLRDSAITLGADTKYSAEEAAQGITEMSKAGVSTADILNGGLNGALSLAAAGQMEVADAAEIGATALSVFRLEGDQMSHVADLLAAGAGKAQGSVHDLGEALNQSALVADQTGLSIEDTAGALAMFANNGLTGSDAGTSFKTMLQALTPNSVAASKAMDAIGFSAYDAQGNFVGLEGVAGQLKAGLSQLTVEQQNATLKTIFGSDAVRAAAILYKEGAGGVREWRDNVNDAGYAAEYAAKLQDNLKGDLEKLGGAFDATMTTIGSGTQGSLRFLVQILTEIVEAGGSFVGFLTDLPAPVQIAVAAVAAFTLLKGPVTDAIKGIGFTLDVMRASAANAGGAMEVARTSARNLAAAAAPLVAITILSAAIASVMEFSRAGDDARASIRAFNDGLRDMSNDARADAVADQIDNARDSIREYQATIEAYDSQGWADRNLWYVPFGGEKNDVEDARQSLEAYERQLQNLEYRNGNAEVSTKALAERFHLTQTEVQDLADKYEIDLGGATWRTALRFGQLYSAEYGTTPIDAANALTGAVASAKEETEAAAEAQKKWLEAAQQVNAGFADLNSAYSGLLDEKTAKERESAEESAATRNEGVDKEIEAVKRRADAEIAGVEGTGAAADASKQHMRDQRDATVESLEESKVSWEDYVDDVDVSLGELAARFEQQLEDQRNWRTNLAQIASWAGQDVANYLFQMGEEGVAIVAGMADGTSAESQRMRDAITEDIRLGSEEHSGAMQDEWRVLEAIGKAGGAATVKGIADELGLGVYVVADIAAQYGRELALGINPVLFALGKDQIRTDRRIAGGATVNSLGLADGGVLGAGESHVAQIAPAGAWRVWAEPETGGEAYIPLAATKRQRSLDIWRETGKKLDAPELEFYADGGLVRFEDGSTMPAARRDAYYSKLGPGLVMAEDGSIVRASSYYGNNGDEIGGWTVPRPPSTAPYGSPISTAADATMQKGYDEVVLTLNYLAEVAAANAAKAAAASASGPVGSGAAGGSWQEIWAKVHARFPTARKTSDYRPGDPGLHGKRKAVDVAGARPGDTAAMLEINRWAAATMGANLAQLIFTPGINLFNGQPHTYNAATRADHYDHVHLGAFDRGGVATGAGYLPKATIAPERVLDPRQTAAFEDWMRSPAAMPGYGAAALGGSYRGGPAGPVHVRVDARVFVGDREITDIARVEAEAVVVEAEQVRYERQVYSR